MKRFESKIALITDGAGSIGKQTAKVFLEEGGKVFLVDSNEDELRKTAGELGSENVKYCAADASKSIDVQHYFDEAIKIYGKVDVFFI